MQLGMGYWGSAKATIPNNLKIVIGGRLEMRHFPSKSHSYRPPSSLPMTLHPSPQAACLRAALLFVVPALR